MNGEKMIEPCDKDGVPASLWIQREIDRGIVERLGFRFDIETWNKAHTVCKL